MSITSDLEQILSARYGKDVRQAIHDSIEEGYNIAVQAQGIAETSQESAKAYAQAALASEQAAEDYKTAAEQAAQQAMSGTPEGYADLVAKVNSIYRQTATSYSIVGTSEGSALAHTIYGMSVQDGTPTPSVPVEIQSAKADFRCTGKNLIPYPYYRQSGYTNNGMTATYDDNGIITINKEVGSATAFFALYNGYKMLKPNTRYKLSMSLENANNTSIYISWNGTDIGGIRNKESGNYDYIFTTPNNASQILCILYYGANTVETNCKVKVMLTLADVDQTYEVNKHKDIITDLNLRAIEVASTDDYNLVRDGKYYIADTVDWSEDEGYKITRRVGREQVTRANYFSDRGSGIKQINYQMSGYSKYNKRGLSNRFKIQAISDSTPDNGEFWIDRTQSLAVFYIETDEITNATTGTTWLTNNPTFIDYVLATPITESITSEQAQALLSLKTYDEATSISATGDIEPSLDLEYSKSEMGAKALTGHNLGFKNALKLNDINTALIELGGN